jgi:hypothetical protein
MPKIERGISVRKRLRAWGAGLLVAGVSAVFLSGGQAVALTGGDEVADGSLPFVAKVSFGDSRACTGVLVDTRWIMTAKNCFTDGTAPVTAGVPTQPTTVLLGRADITTKTAGHKLEVVSLVPHPSRNIVLAELSAPVKDIAPVALGPAPAAGETLRIAGYGRTGAEWVPNRLHAGAFTVGSVSADAFGVQGASGGATLCKGDGGGPAFRDLSTGPQLVGISDTSSQQGCYNEALGTSSGSEARADDLAEWVRTSTAVIPDGLREPVTGEFNLDSYPDLVATDTSGALWLYPGTPTPGVWGHRVLIGSGWQGYHDLAVGRINRDQYDDLVAVQTSTNQVFMWAGTANAGKFVPKVQITPSGWTSDMRDLTIGQVDRDGFDDLLAVQTSTQKLLLFKGTAAGSGFAAGVTDGTGWGCCTQLTLGKFTTDDYPDLLTVNSAGQLRLYAGTAAGTSWVAGVDTGTGSGWGSSSYIVRGRFDDSGLDGVLSVDSTTGLSTLHPRTADGGWAAAVRPTGNAYTPQPYDMTNLVTGEFTRDAYTDLIGTDPTGLLWLFPGTAAHTFGTATLIGSGWTGYRDLVVGRINRDNYDDLVAIQNSTGTLWEYPGTAAGTKFGDKISVGSGWSSDLRDLTVGQVDRDAYDDILTVQNSTNHLLLYKGLAAGNGFADNVTDGTGWNCCDQLTLGNFTSDNFQDLLTVNSAGELHMYPGTADGASWPTNVTTPTGAIWGDRTDLAAYALTPGVHSGLLVKDNTGAMLWYPSGDNGNVDWTDPIAFGPRD